MEEETILDQTQEQRVQEWQYAGFWIRFAAYIIDVLILYAGFFVLMLIFGSLIISQSSTPGNVFNFQVGFQLSFGVLGLLYFSLLESSSYQGTLGKYAVGIKVCDPQKQRISFANAVGRYFGRILSSITLLIGYIMVGFDQHKQGLHDKVANTYVIY